MSQYRLFCSPYASSCILCSNNNTYKYAVEIRKRINIIFICFCDADTNKLKFYCKPAKTYIYIVQDIFGKNLIKFDQHFCSFKNTYDFLYVFIHTLCKAVFVILVEKSQHLKLQLNEYALIQSIYQNM